MTLDHFDSPKLLIERARKHIDELKSAIKAFFERRPYTPITDFDRETREIVYKFRLTAKLPGSFRAIVKDIAANLRDSLDHAVYSAALSLGATDPEKIGFPFANDATHLKGELGTWKFKDIPAELRPLLMSLKPYPEGNDLLISLNRIRNPGTHRVLVPIGTASIGTTMDINSMSMRGGGKAGYTLWLPEKNEIEFMRLERGSHVDCKVNVAFDVMFGDIDAVCEKPVVATLCEIASEVESVVLGIEAETTRILSERP